MLETVTVRTPDERELCVEIAGTRGGGAILVHPGTPNSRHLFEPWIADAERRGLMILAYDRPGYGGSTPRPGHTVADGAHDAAVVADALGIDHFVTWGMSGGGPYALACAAILPDRVSAAGLIGSIAPWHVPGLDYFTGMGKDNVEDIQLMLSDAEAARRKAESDRVEAIELATRGERLSEAWASLVSPTDAAIIAGAFGDYLNRSTLDGLAPGVDGWWDDGVAHLAPWGFDPAAVTVPVMVWHGRQDLFVPVTHGEWLAANIAGAQASITDDDGHLSVAASRIHEVHAWLLEAAGS